MLYQIGALKIDVTPFNAHGVTISRQTDYVPKPVVGAEQPLEYVGEGANTMRLSGTLWPERIGGMGQLSRLQSMRASGSPQFVMRGDGTPLGWWAILDVKEDHRHLGPNGVGNRIDLTINMRRAGRPSGFGLLAFILGMFA
ncbi:MAG: hypothetical protein AUK37_01615 [Rhodobacterales bacterium CG2_30_65_12]|nr:MAG: hypothetical protein AUK37_01615 [Rhodobacterales bacterium CG2_30_65_12]